MYQRKMDNTPAGDLVPLSAESGRTLRAGETTYGEYYGYAQSRTAQARSYLQLLHRQRWIILGVFLAAMVLGSVWLFTRTPMYRSTAEILVTPVDRGGGSGESLAQDISVMMRVRSVATQVRLLKSRDLLDDAFAHLPRAVRERGFETTEPKLANYPVTISNPKDTEIIGIEVTAMDPKAAAAFANTILEASISNRQQNIKIIAEMATEHVTNELTSTEQELKTARATLADAKRKHGIVDLNTQTASDAQSLANLESQVSQAEADLTSAQRRRQTLEREMRRTSQKVTTSRTIGENPVIRSINDQIERLQQERAALLMEYQPTAPEVRNVDNQIAAARRRKTQMIQNVTQSETVSNNPIWEALQRDYISALVAEQEASSRLNTMRAHAGMMRGRIGMLPQYEEELALLLSRVNELQNTHAYLATQLQALRLSMHGGLPNVIPIAHARPSLFPASPNIPVGLLLLTVVAAFAGVMSAVVREAWSDRIMTSAVLETTLGHRVLARIPAVRNGFRSLVVDAQCPLGLLEQFRMLRNSIFLTGQQTQPRVIVITSPHASEGKSTIVANLALTTAMSHKRVLLIDGDLRHPTIHRLYGLENTAGLSTVLEGAAPLAECIRQTPVEHLDVLPAGPMPQFPPELLASPALADLLAAMREHYDVVLLDSTPVVNLSDGAQLASLADGAVMVVAAGATQHADLQTALRILEQVGITVLGIVYNRAVEMPSLEWGEATVAALPPAP